MSIRQLSIKSGVPYSTLRDLVSNKSALEYASCKTVMAIAKALYVSVESLFKEDEFEMNGSQIFIDSKKFYFNYLKNNTNIILKSYSALDYYGYVSDFKADYLQVYSIYKLPEPFIYSKVKNFSKLDYASHNGILVSSIEQAINDLLLDDDYSNKEIRKIFENIHLDNNSLLGNINISKKNQAKFIKLTKGLIKK